MDILLGFVSFLCVYTFSRGIEASQTSYACFKEGESVPQQTEIRCPDGYRIRVLDAIYGVNRWDACFFLEGDCTVTTNDADHCCNQNSCTVTGQRSFVPACGGLPSFLRVVYECVREHVSCPGDSPSNHGDGATSTLSINVPVSASTTAPPASSSAPINTTTTRRYWKTWRKNEARPKVTNTPDEIFLWASVGVGIIAVLLAVAVVVVCVRKRQLQDVKTSNLLKPNGSPTSSNGSSPERPEFHTRSGPDGDSQAFENFVCNKDSGHDVSNGVNNDVSNDVVVTIPDSSFNNNNSDDATQRLSLSEDALDASLGLTRRQHEYNDTVSTVCETAVHNGVSAGDATTTDLMQNYDIANQPEIHSNSVQATQYQEGYST